MARYKVEEKFVVIEGWSKEVKVFRDKHEAKEYATLLNEVYQQGINYAVENPSKVVKTEAFD